jgi:hypothetical protein
MFEVFTPPSISISMGKPPPSTSLRMRATFRAAREHLLATPAGVDGHHHYLVRGGERFLDGGDVRAGVDADARAFPHAADGIERAV